MYQMPLMIFVKFFGKLGVVFGGAVILTERAPHPEGLCSKLFHIVPGRNICGVQRGSGPEMRHGQGVLALLFQQNPHQVVRHCGVRVLLHGFSDFFLTLCIFRAGDERPAGVFQCSSHAAVSLVLLISA